MGRMDKVNHMMLREISTMLQQDMQDPRLQFVTITRVEVSPDLHQARVSYSALGDTDKQEEIQDVLTRASGRIRRIIAKRVYLRYMPRLDFVYDPAIAYSAQIEQTLREIKGEKISMNEGFTKEDE